MYTTRKGTKVLNERISTLAASLEIEGNADEYFVYKDFRIGHPARFHGQVGDRLLVKPCNDAPDQAYVLNLATAEATLLSWGALAHTAKPAEDRS